MSYTSASSRAEEQAIFFGAINTNFGVLSSGATEGNRTSPVAEPSNYDHTYHYGAGSPVQILAQNLGAALDLGPNKTIVDAVEDCLLDELDETYSYADHANDKDWLLFNDNLPTIDVPTDKFFEDADACVYSPAPAYAAATVETTQEEQDEDISLEDVSYDNTVHMADVYEVFNDFETRSRPEYIPAEFEEPTKQESLLQYWAHDYQRHEFIAQKFEHPPYPTVRQSERQ